jgi:hypothetical protein
MPQSVRWQEKLFEAVDWPLETFNLEVLCLVDILVVVFSEMISGCYSSLQSESEMNTAKVRYSKVRHEKRVKKG